MFIYFSPSPTKTPQVSFSDRLLSGDTITFAIHGTILLTEGELVLTKNLTIIGPGATNLVVSGNHGSRILNLASNITVSISGLTLRDGRAPEDGGGIYNCGNLALTNCLVTANAAGLAGRGGGICSFGPLSLAACCISENTAGSGPSPAPPAPPLKNGGNGGGIYCSGPLNLTNCTISKNSAGHGFAPSGSGGHGGGIYAEGFATLIACTVAGNAAGDGSISVARGYIGGGPGGSGGGLYNAGPLLALVACTISSNLAGNGGSDSEFPGAGGSGGGVYSVNSFALTNSTIYANSTGLGGNAGNGGGICCAGSLALVACTVSGNLAGSGIGGGLSADTSGLLLDSLIALNTADSSPDLAGSFTSQGHNLVGQAADASGLTNQVNGDLVGTAAAPVNPLLGPLADNGGPTWTMALLPGSPAIDAGTDDLLIPSCQLTTDQRGWARKTGAHVDIGAVEYQALLGINNCGVQSGSFGFNIIGGGTVVVEASTNLLDWQPVQTNTLTGGSAYFTDPQWSNHPGRFYRLRSPENHLPFLQ